MADDPSVGRVPIRGRGRLLHEPRVPVWVRVFLAIFFAVVWAAAIATGKGGQVQVVPGVVVLFVFGYSFTRKVEGD